MATQFFLRDERIGIGGYRLLATQRGPASKDLLINTVAGATDISGGFWVTHPLRGFTLSGTINFNLRARESNAQANAKLRTRLYRWRPGIGNGANILQTDQAAELGTADAAVALAPAGPGTVFLDGDALVLEVAVTNAGTMGGARVVTLTYDGPGAAAAGDSYVTINPNVERHRRRRITT